MESRRRDTHYRERMLVELNRATHNLAVILKMGVPIRVGQHHVRCAVRAVLVGAVKKTAKVWLNSQCIEVVSTHLIDPCSGWISAGVQPGLSRRGSCQIFEAAVAIA